MEAVELNDKSIHRGESAQRVRRSAGGVRTPQRHQKWRFSWRKENTSKSHDTPRSFPLPSPRVPLSPPPSSSASFSSPSFRPSLPFRPLLPSSFASCVCFLMFSFHLFRSLRTCTAVKCLKLLLFFLLLFFFFVFCFFFFFVKLKIVCKAWDARLKRQVKTCPSSPSGRRLFGRPR